MPSLPEVIAAIPIIISLIVIEGLLSVDNALALAAMVSHLPGRQKVLALRFGIVGAYLFRGLALAFVNQIIENPWLKIVGAAYLIHLMAHHFAHGEAAGWGKKADGLDSKLLGKTFWLTVFSVELMDLSLSVDNVVAAVALSPKLWVVCLGVFIGILALRMVAGFGIKLIEKLPILEETAFVLIGYVGSLLIIEVATHIEISATAKFLGICTILTLSLIFAKSAKVRRLTTPLLKVCRLPLVAYAAVSAPVFGLVFLPVKLIAAFFKKQPRPESETEKTT